MSDYAHIPIPMQQEFDRALKYRCENRQIVIRNDENGLTIQSLTTATRLTVRYNDDYISLYHNGTSHQGASYIAYAPCAEGMKFRLKSHPVLMDADEAARYLVEHLMQDEMP
jgi:hypothetical protein